MTDDLPPLQVALLDDDQLAALFLDIAHAAELVAIHARGANATTWTLDEAHAALRERRVAGLQLRYRHAGAEWWDTLQVLEGGVRLVRIDHTRAVRSCPS